MTINTTAWHYRLLAWVYGTGGLDGAIGMAVGPKGRPEEGHYLVADELVDGAVKVDGGGG